MRTKHIVINSAASNMSGIQDASIPLVVTSPPYPMINMWDDCFSAQDAEIGENIQKGKGQVAFEKMHEILDRVWMEVDRVLMQGGIVCVNIGDATRTINGTFQLFSNHNRIISAFRQMGYCVLPDIIWRKPSNSPTKFMGSGMYPAGAYVTYEHEYILIFRKGGKRAFNAEADRKKRQMSAYFWEERNVWFSDLWYINGTKQKTPEQTNHRRSAAFPFEIPYRLINMYSILGDVVLDPFVGTGTTLLAAMAAGRSSIGVELDPAFADNSLETIRKESRHLNKRTEMRLQDHRSFIENLPDEQRKKCYQNEHYPFLVKTRQEMKAYFPTIFDKQIIEDGVECYYQWPEE